MSRAAVRTDPIGLPGPDFDEGRLIEPPLCPTPSHHAERLQTAPHMPPYIQAVLFDFGDTLVDEASELKDAEATTQRAELIPGAGELVRALVDQQYRLALVADGRPGTYHNVLGQHQLLQHFEALAISELLGVEKPNPRMFQHALNQLGIGARDYPRVVMVGNRLDRDVRGANQLGLISVWIDWSPRYSKTPEDDAETPRFTIRRPLELLPILQELDQAQPDSEH